MPNTRIYKLSGKDQEKVKKIVHEIEEQISATITAAVKEWEHPLHYVVCVIDGEEPKGRAGIFAVLSNMGNDPNEIVRLLAFSAGQITSFPPDERDYVEEPTKQ